MLRQFWMLLALPLALWSGCGAGPEVETTDDLTSNAAVERELTLRAYVYVEDFATSFLVQNAVQQQLRTAFGPLRIGRIMVDDREFGNNIDPGTFHKTVVEVVKKNADGTIAVQKKMARV